MIKILEQVSDSELLDSIYSTNTYEYEELIRRYNERNKECQDLINLNQKLNEKISRALMTLV